MRVVALVPGGIGEQILFFPTLDDLKRLYPNAQIDVAVEPRAKAAYRVCKSVGDIIPFDFKDRNSLADWGNFIGVLRDREYDVAIYLGQQRAISLMLWLTGIPTRVAYKGAGTIFLTDTVPLKTEQYAVTMYHDLLQGLGSNLPCPEITINVPASDIAWSENEQKRLGVSESGYILIHGGSSQGNDPRDLEKIYPQDKWRQIVQNIQQRQPNLPVVVVKEPDNEQFANSLLESSPGIKVTSPQDTGKLAATIAGANLFICTDSPALQLAVAVKTYTIALFGPTEPEKMLPKSDRFFALRSPSKKISDISPQTVLDRVWGS